MAVAAETLNWTFEEELEYVRSPKEETYGRSLTTIFRLGRLMVENSVADVAHSPEAEQTRAEFYTSVEEGFGTDKELGGGLQVRDFDLRPVIDGRVMAKDLKTAVSEMTQAGLICARETADKDKRFLPQLTRSKWDHQNALIVDKMVQGETGYNTRIIVSPFPEEAAAKSGNKFWQDIGYVPHLKRAFVQLYHVNEEGLLAGSLSFDGSEKEKIREVLHRLGVEIPLDEITDNYLGYAYMDTLQVDDAKALGLAVANDAGDAKYNKTTNTVDLTRQHRAAMEAAFNDSYIHACESHARGIQTPKTRQLIMSLAHEAGHFNKRYASALYKMRENEKQFTDDDMAVIHELLVFSTIEMMRAVHLKEPAPNFVSSGASAVVMFNQAHIESMNEQEFQKVLSGFGATGARENRVYSACGLSISLGGEPGNDDPQSAFGGLSSKELSWHGGSIKKGKCVNCHKDTDVGVKSWCKKCIKC
ncbi:MAG: hypothetical protein QFB86_02975 [Patescibacteria group bacterium]|nr:hypothetical protein [Patescibacteria group bacterium]